MWPFRRFVPNEETLRAFEEVEAHKRGEIELEEWTPHARVGSCDAKRRYTITKTTSYKRDVRRLEKQGADFDVLNLVIENLSRGYALDRRFRDHALKGEWKGKRECHIEPDWILVYEIKERELILYLVRTGSHADVLGRRPRGRTGPRRSRGLAEKARGARSGCGLLPGGFPPAPRRSPEVPEDDGVAAPSPARLFK